jgi:hypothetical protein
MPLNPSLSDLNEDIRRLCKTIDDQGREYWWIKPEVAAAFEAGGYHLLPRHFYSPIADPETTSGTDFDKELYPLRELNFSESDSMSFVNFISDYSEELEREFPTTAPSVTGFYWNNPFFTGLDAAALYTLIRTVRPKRIVEIGSGFSSHISLRALERNGHGKLTSVEPYPTATLLELSDQIQTIQCSIQNAPQEIFASLAAGDILFIDSSHVSCLGSDVNFEIFEILPSLPAGAIVHFHDVFLPFEYPREWVVNRRWNWNEQYLLYAFLRMNDSFEVWMPNSYITRRHPLKVSAALPFLNVLENPGSSFWMRKTR